MLRKLMLVVSLLLVGAIVPAGRVAAQSRPVIPIYIDGGAPVMGTIIDDRAVAAVDTLAAALGFTAKAESESVTFGRPGLTIRLPMDYSEIVINDHEFFGDAAPVLADGTMYVPVRFIAQNSGYRVLWNAQDRSVHLQSFAQNGITISTAKIVEEDEQLKVKIQYPQFAGLAPEAAQKLNDFFANHAQEIKAQATTDAAELATVPDYQFKYELYADYQIHYNQHGLLSVALDDYIFSGGAHGSTIRHSHTFDLGTGHELALADWFVPGADYVQILSDEVKRQIAVRELMLLTPFETIQADEDYFLSPEGLVIYFQQYEYTPYSYGMPEFVIPYTRLADILAVPLASAN